MTRAKIILLAVLAITAFAGNSVIARLALGDGLIGPGPYSLIRLVSGALILLPMLGRLDLRRDFPGGLALGAYVIFFSWAYLSLSAGVGALILFACVQVTVFAIGARNGERPGTLGLLGMALALGGLFALVAPSQSQATLQSALLMAVAGIGWGFYTMLGRAAGVASRFNARSFLIATLLAVPVLLVDASRPSLDGLFLAVLSGTITSALGYVVWSRVSPALGVATVATVQLATPPAAAIGGVAILGEALTLQFLIASAGIIGGIVLTLWDRRRPSGQGS